VEVNNDVPLLKFKSTEELIREKQGLEDFAAAAMAEGVQPPEDIKEQIQQLRNELQRRHVADQRAESPEQWIGARMNDCVIETLIHESKFAYVFRAKTDNGLAKAVRLAKSDISVEAARNRTHTYSFRMQNEEIMPYPLPPHMVLREQIEILNRMEPILPGSIESRGFEGERPFYTMPFHDGQTLRELIELGSIPLDVYLVQIFQNLIDTLVALEKAKIHHGNLKPEHVIVTKQGIHLLSPGYDGVTTPEYYPYLTADDRLAVGIMLFECVCKVHPFAINSDAKLESRLSPEYQRRLHASIQHGFFALSGALRFRTPVEIKPSLSEAASEFLVKALCLEFDSKGELTSGTGFTDWQSLREGLSVLA
jgi:hypothetical protein